MAQEAEYGSTMWCMQHYLWLLNKAMDHCVRASSEEERKRYARIIANNALVLVTDALDVERGEDE